MLTLEEYGTNLKKLVEEGNLDPVVGTGRQRQIEKDIDAEVEVKYEDKVDRPLDGLGPRYLDWPGLGPLTVDAYLLLGIIAGYQPPRRVLLYGVRSTLATKETPALRRRARTLPPHFATG